MLLNNISPNRFNKRIFLRYHGTQATDKNYLHQDLSSDSGAQYIRVARDNKLVECNEGAHQPSKGDSLKDTSGSYPVLRSSGLQHWFKNWQELRKHKLTASTFAGAVGFWHGRRVQLWKEKLGLFEPFVGNLATCWSNLKEEIALERYKLITGNALTYPAFQHYNKTNPEDDWLGASPDGIVEHFLYGLPCGGVLEVKCPFYNGELREALPWTRIPIHYMPQAQGLMEILDKSWMDFYVWTPNGSSLFRIYRDQQYWELLKFALSDFWWKHVQPAKELCLANPRADWFTLVKPLKPPPRHELCRDIVCASKCLVDDSKLLVREIRGKLRY